MAKKNIPEAAPPPFNLEQSLGELEGLVERMEHGELSLEQALKDFERGVELTRRCEGALREAEQKVQMLTEKGTLAPFEPEGEGGA